MMYGLNMRKRSTFFMSLYVRGVVLLLLVVGVLDDNACSDGKGYSYQLGAPLYSSTLSLEI